MFWGPFLAFPVSWRGDLSGRAHCRLARSASGKTSPGCEDLASNSWCWKLEAWGKDGGTGILSVLMGLRNPFGGSSSCPPVPGGWNLLVVAMAAPPGRRARVPPPHRAALPLIFLSEPLPVVTGLPLRGSCRRVPERVTPEEMLALLFSSWALSLVPILPGYTDTCSNSLSTGGGYWAT